MWLPPDTHAPERHRTAPVPLLAELPRPELRRIADTTTLRRLTPGGRASRQGGRPGSLPLLLAGSVAVLVHAEGIGDLPVGELEVCPGDGGGEGTGVEALLRTAAPVDVAALGPGGRAGATTRAESACLVGDVPIGALEELAGPAPAYLARLYRRAAGLCLSAIAGGRGPAEPGRDAGWRSDGPPAVPPGRTRVRVETRPAATRTWLAGLPLWGTLDDPARARLAALARIETYDGGGPPVLALGDDLGMLVRGAARLRVGDATAPLRQTITTPGYPVGWAPFIEVAGSRSAGVSATLPGPARLLRVDGAALRRIERDDPTAFLSVWRLGAWWCADLLRRHRCDAILAGVDRERAAVAAAVRDHDAQLGPTSPLRRLTSALDGRLAAAHALAALVEVAASGDDETERRVAAACLEPVRRIVAALRAQRRHEAVRQRSLRKS